MPIECTYEKNGDPAVAAAGSPYLNHLPSRKDESIMPRNMTNIKKVSGTELVNAYFTMVRSDIGKSVASLRAKEEGVFAETCENLVSSSFLSITAMRAYKSGNDVSDPREKLNQMLLTKAMIINRMNHDIAEMQAFVDGMK